MLSGYYRKGCPDVAEIWSSKKIDPAGGGIDDIRRLLWWRCARASARFLFACGLPAPGPVPPAKLRPRLWAGRTAELLPKLRPAAGCPQQAGQRAHEPDPAFSSRSLFFTSSISICSVPQKT